MGKGRFRGLVLAGLLLTGAGAAAAAATSPDIAKPAEDGRSLRLTVVTARPSKAEGAGTPFLLVTFDRESAGRLRALTDANLGRILEILLDGTLLAEPRILESVAGETVQIAGGFGADAVREMARRMNSGGVLTVRVRD